MSQHETLFGYGDLAARMAALVGDTDGAPDGTTVDEKQLVYVHVGQLYATGLPQLVSTILGSCVAVCLWDPIKGVGGLNHYLLPQRVENGVSSPRFGNVAIERLIGAVSQLGGDPARLKAKIFGGASVIDAFSNERGSLGQSNVELARQLLEASRIPVVAEDVGGTQGRKVMFRPADGSAWVRRI